MREPRAPLLLDPVVAGDLVQRAFHHLSDCRVFVLQSVTVDLQPVVDEIECCPGTGLQGQSRCQSRQRVSVNRKHLQSGEWAVTGDPLVGGGDFFRCDRRLLPIAPHQAQGLYRLERSHLGGRGVDVHRRLDVEEYIDRRGCFTLQFLVPIRRCLPGEWDLPEFADT